MAVLQSFYQEREQQSERFESLKVAVQKPETGIRWSMDDFSEDWNSSQFWVIVQPGLDSVRHSDDRLSQYSDETATALARELLRGTSSETRIAVVSAPSVFVQMKNLFATEAMPHGQARICLLEYDQRFSVFQEDYKHYDYQQPLRLGADMKGAFDRVFCDPPFLSEDCQTKAAMTVRWLCKEYNEQSNELGDLHHRALKPRIIVCTGERMGELIRRLHPDIFTTDFEPQHAQGRLGNDFMCFADYESSLWSLR